MPLRGKIKLQISKGTAIKKKKNHLVSSCRNRFPQFLSHIFTKTGQGQICTSHSFPPRRKVKAVATYDFPEKARQEKYQNLSPVYLASEYLSP